MKKNAFVMTLAVCGLMATGCSHKLSDNVTKAETHLAGGYGRTENPTDRDLKVFRAAVKDIVDLQELMPIAVSRQVVAGMNYIFYCQPKDGKQSVTVKIFEPLPGRGEPSVVSVE